MAGYGDMAVASFSSLSAHISTRLVDSENDTFLLFSDGTLSLDNVRARTLELEDVAFGLDECTIDG